MTFAAPAMLWFLLALAIPIAVHLFNFRRYRKVYFSNVERLASLRSESRRQSEVRRWLVLAARLVAVGALVLAFARPTLPQKGQALHSGATVVSLFVDNSYSMEAQGSAGTLLDEARVKAREIAAAYGPSTRFQLLTPDLSGERFRWLGHEELYQALDTLQAGPSSVGLDQAVRRQLDFMRQSGAANRHAYVVSDFQQSVAGLDRLPADSLSLVTLVPLEGVSSDNLYIDTVRLDAPAYFVGGRVSVEAGIRNSGTRDAESVPVRLVAGGRQRAVATLDIPGGGSATATMHFTLDSAGWVDGTVEIADYPVTFDDRYHFAVLAGQPVMMLETYAQQPNGSLRRLFEGDSAVQYSAAALPPDLGELHFIVLGEPAALPSGQAQALAAWVEDGGTLAIVPPAQGDMEGLNALLGMLRAPRLDAWTGQSLKAVGVDYEASLYRNVFSATSDEMELPTVQGCYRMGTGQAVCQPIITLADGSPLLSHTPCGQGHLYLFAMPLRPEWTDFVHQALFVPTLYNMALYSRPQPAPSHTLGGTAPIPLQGWYSGNARPPTLQCEGGDAVIPEIRTLGSRSLLVPHGEISQAGHYRLGDEQLAFNYSRLESELTFYSPAEVAEAVEGRRGYSTLRNTTRPLDQEIRSRTAGKPLWRWCLLVALVALAVETLLIKQPWSSK